MRKRILSAEGLSGIIEGLLRVLFVIGILTTVTLPFTLGFMPVRWVRSLRLGPAYWPLLIFLFAFGILMLAFVYNAARIFRTINKNDPFVDENVQSLNNMSVISLLLCIDCGLYALAVVSVTSIVLCLLFLFLWALFLVLRELFRSAVDFKRENDYTI